MQNIRKEFPILNSCIYLDSAATAHKPKVVVEAISSFLSQRYGTVHRAVYQLAQAATEEYNQVRQSVRKFLDAEMVEEIIFTKGTTEAINLVAYSFGEAFIQPEDEILISHTEHHANIVPWQVLCQRKGAILRVIPVDDRGEICLEQLAEMITPKVKMVSIAYIANATGVVHPIKEIIRLAHAQGAKVFVDAAQAAPHMRISVQEMQPDFLAFSGHKAYGPTGIGVLYGKKELLEQMPPYQTGGDMIRTVSFEKTTYQDPPLKFEAGTPSIAEVIGLGAALAFIEGIGIEHIAEWERDLTEYAIGKLAKIDGLKFLCEPRCRGPIISFNCEGAHPLDIGSLLSPKIAVRTGHQCAQPALQRFGVTSTVRVSFGVYNTKEEIDLFKEFLQDVLRILR